MRRLSREALAGEAQTTPARIDELVRIGALAPQADGSFEGPDVQRVAVVDAYEAAGIGSELIALAIERRWMTLNRADELYPDRGPRSSRPFAEFRASLGDRAANLNAVLAALGLPSPDPDSRITLRDERLLDGFLEAWQLSDDRTIPIRAARVAGEGIRRIVGGWLDLFGEQVTRPLEDRTRTVDELQPMVLPRASRITASAPEFLVWLFERHLEAGLHAENVAAMEVGLAREGLLPRRPRHPPAIVFVDLAGYTRLTQEHGDELAARSAARLAELAEDASTRRGGRLVKLLGDGAMLYFGDPGGAVEAGLDLVRAVPAAGLPAAHVGIDAGPIVGRDGDFFGHTVNVAARLSSRAAGGEVIVTRDVLDAVGEGSRLRFEPLGDVTLKNVIEPVAVFRAARDR